LGPSFANLYNLFRLDDKLMPSPPAHPDPFVFGRFTLAADASLLTVDGVAVPLAPKVLQTLRALVARAGEVVSKDDLMREVWGDTVVEEIGLARNVSLLRRALGPDAERYIVTVPRIGYRFAGPIRRNAPDHAGEVGAVEPTDTFVGRARELSLLHEVLAAARAGRGCVVGLTGEPGIGKTTLAEQFVSTVRASVFTGVGRSSELFGTTEPHLPILEALQELARTSATVSKALTAVAPTWAGHVTGVPRAVGATADTPERLLRELTNFFEIASRERPVVLVFDDLHWADAATADAVAHLARRIARLRVLLIGTYRDRALATRGAPFAQVRTDLLARRQLKEMALPLLAREEVTTYVSRAADPVQAVALVDRVYASSEGNPLFMSALVSHLITSGAADAGGSTGATPMPETLRALIQTTLVAISPAQRDVLDTAAICGLEFDADVVARALGMSPLEVEDLLAAITDEHGVIGRHGESVSGSAAGPFRFRHALYQAALLDALLPSRRASLAGRLAGAQRARHDGDPSMAGAIASLLELARSYGDAARYFARASQHATTRLAFRDAHDLALRGMECLTLANDLPAVEQQRIELALTFAQLAPLAPWRGHGHPTVGALTDRASSLAAQLEDNPSMARALGLECFVRLARAECTAARDVARRLIALATRARDTSLLMNAHLQAQIACHHLGDFAGADEHAVEVERHGSVLAPAERFLSLFDPLVASLAESSRNAWVTGRLRQASAYAEAAIAVATEIGNLESQAFAWLFHAWLHGYKEDWRTCLQSAGQGIAIARHGGTVQTLAWNRCVHGWARALTGDVAGGQDELREGMDLSQSLMGHVALPQFRAMMAQAHLADGNLTSARTWIDDALHAAHDHDDRYVAAEIHRLAALCGARGPHDLTPTEHAREAIAVSRAQGAMFFELRAAHALADLTSDIHPIAVALERLPEPEAWPDVVRARRRLASAASA
jgi:DNA-binding winged helix-turn-helix (wHTH) protein/predicted ATPase